MPCPGGAAHHPYGWMRLPCRAGSIRHRTLPRPDQVPAHSAVHHHYQAGPDTADDIWGTPLLPLFGLQIPRPAILPDVQPWASTVTRATRVKTTLHCG